MKVLSALERNRRGYTINETEKFYELIDFVDSPQRYTSRGISDSLMRAFTWTSVGPHPSGDIENDNLWRNIYNALRTGTTEQHLNAKLLLIQEVRRYFEQVSIDYNKIAEEKYSDDLI